MLELNTLDVQIPCRRVACRRGVAARLRSVPISVVAVSVFVATRVPFQSIHLAGQESPRCGSDQFLKRVS